MEKNIINNRDIGQRQHPTIKTNNWNTNLPIFVSRWMKCNFFPPNLGRPSVSTWTIRSRRHTMFVWNVAYGWHLSKGRCVIIEEFWCYQLVARANCLKLCFTGCMVSRYPGQKSLRMFCGLPAPLRSEVTALGVFCRFTGDYPISETGHVFSILDLLKKMGNLGIFAAAASA